MRVEVIDYVEADTLQPLISQKVSTCSIVCSDPWKAYTGIAARGYVHRLVYQGERQYSDRKGDHINGLKGFLGYMKRKLASKGGIRKERLPLFLGEYVWIYNHRSDPECEDSFNC
jgi:transposase-like protein